MSKEKYSKNKQRLFEIYGIPKEKRRKYSVHHIVFRREGGTNEMSNLYPLLTKVHRALHSYLDGKITREQWRDLNQCMNKSTTL